MSLSRLAAKSIDPGSVAAANVQVAQDSSKAAAVPADTFDALVRYIPTETITLYVAAASAFDAIEEVAPTISMRDIYWVGIVLTPVILLLIAFGRHRQQNDGTKFRVHWWPFAASAIAFSVWALSVPGLVTSEPARLLAALGALCISTLLSLLEPALGPRP